MAAACGGGNDVKREPEPLVVGGQIDARLAGVWRVLGEGRWLQVARGGATQFEQAATVCYTDERGSTSDPAELATMQFRIDHAEGGAPARVELFESPDAPASALLERVAAVPADCLQSVPASPAKALDALCELMGQDYAFFIERGVDWPARCKALAPAAAAASTRHDAMQQVLTDALRGLRDPHVKLYRRGPGDEASAPVFSAGDAATPRLLAEAFAAQTEITDFREFQLAWRDALAAQIDVQLTGASGPQLGGALRWGRLPGGVGYINLYRMAGFSDDPSPATERALIGKALDRALEQLADTQALIIDVSLNGGGLDLASAEVAGRFADQRRLAFTKSWHRPEGRPPQHWFVEPRGARQYRKPVYLLTSDLTGSAAETFTLMMRALPQVVHAGEPTAGAISDILEKALPGGFSVTFSSEIDRDPQGRLFEVTGIPPARPLPMFAASGVAGLLDAHAAAVTTLVASAGR